VREDVLAAARLRTLTGILWSLKSRLSKIEIVDLLPQHATLGTDQGLTVSEIASRLGRDGEVVRSALPALDEKGAVHQQSFWWYPGRGPDTDVEVDQR